jgi:hypothetical protein
MTTQPVGTRGSVYVSGGATGYAAQPVTWSSLRRSMPRRSQQAPGTRVHQERASDAVSPERDPGCWSGEL